MGVLRREVTIELKATQLPMGANEADIQPGDGVVQAAVLKEAYLAGPTADWLEDIIQEFEESNPITDYAEWQVEPFQLPAEMSGQHEALHQSKDTITRAMHKQSGLSINWQEIKQRAGEIANGITELWSDRKEEQDNPKATVWERTFNTIKDTRDWWRQLNSGQRRMVAIGGMAALAEMATACSGTTPTIKPPDVQANQPTATEVYTQEDEATPTLTPTEIPTQTPEPTATPTETPSVPVNIQNQVEQYFGEPGMIITQADGTTALIGTSGTVLAQETEKGWEITENPKQVEASLGYENITDGTFIYLPGTEIPNLLVSEEQGVLGYYDYAHESWKSTQGWKEVILADGRLNQTGNFQEDVIFFTSESFEYHLMGITDGVAIEKPFEIKTDSGELLATNELAYRIYYLDTQQKLQSMMVALVVKLPDGSHFPMENQYFLNIEYGSEPTLEQMKSYFKKYFENMPGKITHAGFWATPEDVDKFLKVAETYGQVPPYEYERFKLLKKQIAGRLEDYQKLVESGDPGLGIILINQGASLLYGDEPWIVELP
jgi:hypothetical protein